MRLFIFNFRFIIFFLIVVFVLNIATKKIVEYVVNNSEFRLSRVINENIPKEVDKIFIGNSRAVSFNGYTLKNENQIFNSAYNGLNYDEINLILSSISKNKSFKNKTVFLEVSSLESNYDIRCDLFLYLNKQNIKNEKFDKKCKKYSLFAKIFPAMLVNSEIFLRNLYYFINKNEDQKWFNNYKITKELCNSNLKNIFKIPVNEVASNANTLLETYPDINFIFFLSPFLKDYHNYEKLEKKLYNRIKKSFFLMNYKIENNFFNNCDNFADTIHLSFDGTKEFGLILLQQKNH